MKVFHSKTPAPSSLRKSLAVVFSGNVIAAALGFLALLIISRELTISDFGLFSIAIAVIKMGARLSEFGMETSMIKFVASYLSRGEITEASQVVNLSGRVRIIINMIVTVILFNTAGIISIKVFHDTSLIPLLKLTALGILVVATFNYLKCVLFAYRMFQQSAILQFLVDMGKLFSVVVLVLLGRIDVFFAVFVFSIAPIIGILVGLGQLRHKLFSKQKPLEHLFSRLFSYSKWLFVSNICSVTFSSAAIFLLARELNSEAAGIYGLAFNLTYIFLIINDSLKSVLLPEVSRFTTTKQVDTYLKKSIKILFWMGITIIPFLLFSHKMIPFIFGKRYFNSVKVFNWLTIGYIFYTVNSTIQVTLHSLNKPQVLAFIDFVRLVVMVVGCYLLIPFFEVLAPAIMTLIINVSIMIFLSYYVLKKIRIGSIGYESSF